jgi:hypothetical protein
MSEGKQNHAEKDQIATPTEIRNANIRKGGSFLDIQRVHDDREAKGDK